MPSYVEKISYYIQKELNLSEEKREVIAYGMDTFVSTTLGILGIIVFGYLFGLIVPALIISMSALTTRVFTGGAHCGSMVRCTIVTIVTFIFLAYIGSNLLITSSLIILAFYIISVVIIIRYAPVEVKQKPLSEPHKKQLRKGAFRFSFILGIILLLTSQLHKQLALFMVSGFLWQSFSITPLGFKTINYIDGFLKLIWKGGKIHEET